MCIDDAHLFKNLSFPTRIPGVGGGQAKRATDLDLKLQYLRHTYGGRTAIFATATFVANSVAEMWVMQHYLQPYLLQAANVEHFDAWAATFGRKSARPRALQRPPRSCSFPWPSSTPLADHTITRCFFRPRLDYGYRRAVDRRRDPSNALMINRRMTAPTNATTISFQI